MPALTIGMAHAKDFHGAYFTIQAMRLGNPEVAKDLEFVVVDNQPQSSHSVMLRDFINGLAHSHQTAGAKYVPLHEPVGTSPARNEIFSHATGHAVLVVDCHVLLPPGTLTRLVDFYEKHDPGANLYQGPLVYDNLQNIATHFNDQWRGEMWGTWGQAWRCSCGTEGEVFSVMEGEGGRAEFVQLGPKHPAPYTHCHACDRLPPRLPWAGHEKALLVGGYTIAAQDPEAPAFDIPGQGLGLFTCRRDAWLGFNPHARQFGGEELYIHAKYRKAGHRALCLPWLRWVHRFGRPDGVPYPLGMWHKVRNYVLELNELELPLDPVHAHFVATGRMPEAEWDYLVADPVGHEVYQREASGCGTCGSAPAAPQANINTVEEAFAWVVSHPRDMEKHLPKLRELASQCRHVTELSHRRESTVALVAGGPDAVVSYNTEHGDPVSLALDAAVPNTTQLVRSSTHPNTVTAIAGTDMVFIDTLHTYEHVLRDLRAVAPRCGRYIVLHDTQLYGHADEGGPESGPGMLAALRVFMQENPQWSVVYHTDEQYGLTVLGCQDGDKPTLPSKVKMATNFAKAVAAHVASGSQHTNADELQARLEVCTVCDQRRDDRCTVCGCPVEEKAKWREQDCPLLRWPALEAGND